MVGEMCVSIIGKFMVISQKKNTQLQVNEHSGLTSRVVIEYYLRDKNTCTNI